MAHQQRVRRPRAIRATQAQPDGAGPLSATTPSPAPGPDTAAVTALLGRIGRVLGEAN